jgi:hypothetical protein
VRNVHGTVAELRSVEAGKCLVYATSYGRLSAINPLVMDTYGPFTVLHVPGEQAEPTTTEWTVEGDGPEPWIFDNSIDWSYEDALRYQRRHGGHLVCREVTDWKEPTT